MSLKKIAEELNLPEKVVEIAQKVDQWLTSQKIPHMIIGGIAVGAYSKPRTTSDVDFLVPYDARSIIANKYQLSPLEMADRDGETTMVDGIEVDFIYPNDNEDFLLENFVQHSIFPISGKNQLLYLKLKSGRTSDSQDVIQIVKGMPQKDRLAFIHFMTGLDGTEEFLEDFESYCQIADLENAKELKLASGKFQQHWLKKLGGKIQE